MPPYRLPRKPRTVPDVDVVRRRHERLAKETINKDFYTKPDPVRPTWKW